MVYQSIATVIAGLLIAGAIVYSRSTYSFISTGAAVIKMDNRTGEMTACQIEGSHMGFLKMECKVLVAEYP